MMRASVDVFSQRDLSCARRQSMERQWNTTWNSGQPDQRQVRSSMEPPLVAFDGSSCTSSVH